MTDCVLFSTIANFQDDDDFFAMLEQEMLQHNTKFPKKIMYLMSAGIMQFTEADVKDYPALQVCLRHGFHKTMIKRLVRKLTTVIRMFWRRDIGNLDEFIYPTMLLLPGVCETNELIRFVDEHIKQVCSIPEQNMHMTFIVKDDEDREQFQKELTGITFMSLREFINEKKIDTVFACGGHTHWLNILLHNHDMAQIIKEKKLKWCGYSAGAICGGITTSLAAYKCKYMLCEEMSLVNMYIEKYANLEQTKCKPFTFEGMGAYNFALVPHYYSGIMDDMISKYKEEKNPPFDIHQLTDGKCIFVHNQKIFQFINFFSSLLQKKNDKLKIVANPNVDITNFKDSFKDYDLEKNPTKRKRGEQ